MSRQHGFQGRRWDAPITDDMPFLDLAGLTCSVCEEPIGEYDDAMLLGSVGHTECWLRSTLGSVAHLEGRCSCFGGDDGDENGVSCREAARQVVDWLVAHREGSWA